jgi:hypothetical protein
VFLSNTFFSSLPINTFERRNESPPTSILENFVPLWIDISLSLARTYAECHPHVATNRGGGGGASGSGSS